MALDRKQLIKQLRQLGLPDPEGAADSVMFTPPTTPRVQPKADSKPDEGLQALDAPEPVNDLTPPPGWSIQQGRFLRPEEIGNEPISAAEYWGLNKQYRTRPGQDPRVQRS